jgi:tRNA U34 5-methylaminomethyl-2-thiouridine-forming methyltransferase MnmC
MENRELGIRTTGDGSITFYSDQFDQHYHSIFGARTESERVFIELGYNYIIEHFNDAIQLLEVGFGTGLNAWLTGLSAEKSQRLTEYVGLEAYPLPKAHFEHFPGELQAYQKLAWGEQHTIHPYYNVIKQNVKVQDFLAERKFHLVYYDAFSPEAQPEMWSEDLFLRIAGMMETGGVLSTYCSKGMVQRNLKAVGFEVEKHPGPPRKREVLRAIKK